MEKAVIRLQHGRSCSYSILVCGTAMRGERAGAARPSRARAAPRALCGAPPPVVLAAIFLLPARVQPAAR